MSDKTEEWEKKIGTIVKAELQNWKPKIEGPPSSSNPEHKSHDTIADLLSCPDCGPKWYPDMKKAVIEREFKDADHECEECGLPVRGEESAKEDWECPGCGHKYAKPK